ncbi:hypothetical protein AB0F92_33535 [Kitasatospora aureofaciens]|uniref:hypothetical protein n=1 Tax=Kitasatospora aureofaciens TaxID=1894 RepID=UPI0004BF8409
MKLSELSAWISLGLFWLDPAFWMSLASCHQLVPVPRMLWSPRPSIRPWPPSAARTASMPALAPATLISGRQPPLDGARVPQAGLPESW